jgi:hypothetical protein
MGDVLRYAGRGHRNAPIELDAPMPGEGVGARANELATSGGGEHALDKAEAREEHRKLLQWYYYERDRQAINRLEMAIDHDFYDNEQWDEDDAAIVESRKQAALVFNEVAPMCDWVIGTERRARVDWKVLPRTEDDVQVADVKTKVLKYVSDVNRVQLHRSRAFSDAVKGGIGWMDDGVRDDPTQERIYSRYEDWRCVLHDSSALDILGEEGRFLFRWRWVDEDIAVMMFPGRAERIRSAIEDWAFDTYEDEFGDNRTINGAAGTTDAARFMGVGSVASAMVDAQRRRVKLIECQYKKPVPIKVIASGRMAGALFDPRDKALAAALAAAGSSATIIDKIAMRTFTAVFTEADMLAWGPTPYRHNRFTLTPVICYRRNRDRQVYGMIRRVRGIQLDINKRASKAQHLLNTNQIIGDRDAFDDWEQAREEAQNPDGVLPKKPGTQVEIRSGVGLAQGQFEVMNLNQQAIQRSFGVNDENLGRKTNAVSGEAIKARQIQGSVATTEPFDNLRWSTKAQGEKQLSLIEQFMTEDRVIRLTDANGMMEWVKVNQPVLEADGQVRFLNDITASMADFVVAEQDYAGTLRQVMFDAMTSLAQRQPPEVALRFLRMAFQYSDLPNKDELVSELRKLLGEPDPSKQMTPEEQAQVEQQQQQQAEAMQLQRQQAIAAVEEQQAKARKIAAEAEKMMVEVDRMRQGLDLDGTGGHAAVEQERMLAQVREQAASEIESMAAKLQKVTGDLQRALAQKDADVEVARIQAEAQRDAAEIQAASDKRLEALTRKLEDMARDLADTRKTADQAVKAAEQVAKAQAEEEADDKGESDNKPEPAEAAPAAPPITLNLQVDARGAEGSTKRTVVIRKEGDKMIGEVKDEGDKE